MTMMRMLGRSFLRRSPSWGNNRRTLGRIAVDEAIPTSWCSKRQRPLSSSRGGVSNSDATFSILTKSESSSSSSSEISTIREHLRQYGSTDNECSIQFQLCSESTSKSLSSLGASTGIITLNNPASRNALTGKMMAELSDVVTELETNPTYRDSLMAVIVRGTGGFFCAGADLGVAKQHLLSKEGGRMMSTLMIDTLTRLRKLPFVTVSAIEGFAIGGGAELTTATDYRLASNQAKIRFVQSTMGVTPGWGGGARLVKLVRRQHALRILGTAKPIAAQDGMNIGFIDDIVACETESDEDSSASPSSSVNNAMDDALVQFLNPFVRQEHPPSVLHANKNVVSNCDDSSSFEEALRREHETFQDMWGGDANLAALTRVARQKDSKKPGHVK